MLKAILIDDDYRDREILELLLKKILFCGSICSWYSGYEFILETKTDLILQLHTLYAEADTKRKREITGSIYTEKLTLEGMVYRTYLLNKADELI